MKYLPSISVTLLVISAYKKKKIQHYFPIKWKKLLNAKNAVSSRALFHNLSSECTVSSSKHMHSNKSS